MNTHTVTGELASYCKPSKSFWQHRDYCDYIVKSGAIYRMADGLPYFRGNQKNIAAKVKFLRSEPNPQRVHFFEGE